MLIRLERAITRLGLPQGYDGDPLAEDFREPDTLGDIVAACELLQRLPANLRNWDRRLAHRMCPGGRIRPDPCGMFYSKKWYRRKNRPRTTEGLRVSEQLEIHAGPVDRNGRRLVIATFGGQQHRDRIDTDDAFRRRSFREQIVERFRLGEDAHEWIERRILEAADVEDELSEPGSCSRDAPAQYTPFPVEALPLAVGEYVRAGLLKRLAAMRPFSLCRFWPA